MRVLKQDANEDSVLSSYVATLCMPPVRTTHPFKDHPSAICQNLELMVVHEVHIEYAD